jgi:rod shape-determining protein MreD
MRSQTNVYLPLIVLPTAVLLQTTILPRMQVGGFRLDLVLLAVVAWSLLRGVREGMYWGLIGGSMIGLFTVAPFGVHALAMMLAGFISGVGVQNVFRQNLLLSFSVATVATVLYYLATMALLTLVGWQVSWDRALITVVVPTTLFNALAIPVVYRILHPLRRLTGPRELSW